MRRKKLKINAVRWLLTIINLAGIFLIAGNRYLGYIDLNIPVVPYLLILAYGIVSMVLIKGYSDHKLKNMYLHCSMDDIDEMTGTEFEVYLYYKFRKQGYRVKLTPVSGDYGADLVLKKKREKIVVQAKRYQRDVGIAAVQEVIGSIAYYEADRGLVVTNSFFTLNAINLAAANDILLWDRRALITCLIKEEEDLETYEENRNELESVRYCPVCGKKLVHRKGPYGQFLGCSGYPKCSYTEPVSDQLP